MYLDIAKWIVRLLRSVNPLQMVQNTTRLNGKKKGHIEVFLLVAGRRNATDLCPGSAYPHSCQNEIIFTFICCPNTIAIDFSSEKKIFFFDWNISIGVRIFEGSFMCTGICVVRIRIRYRGILRTNHHDETHSDRRAYRNSILIRIKMKPTRS